LDPKLLASDPSDDRSWRLVVGCWLLGRKHIEPPEL
jgi:hypothetical protein